eukprot:CAMPEP_0114494102 /NCGR_PEP_ID=MMETSP0109-20121206/4469_1 /TAXON_ID=29199 /ORGANISM="Chlorarachnion reptans, Strain CCCM449" /LENGTH=337 /DNA_ID=CAMNT_0001671109 /DNA_START=114 /DNA_END=1127 /DNA_ORIENTATION=-
MTVSGQTERFKEFIFADGTSKRVPLGVAQKPKYVLEQESGIYSLKRLRFSETKKMWIDTKLGGETGTTNPPTTNSMSGDEPYEELRMVTYNVWFSPRNQAARAKALISITLSKKPHIICFQEVTPVFLSILKADPRIQKEFTLSDTTGTTLRGSKLQYGVLMCVHTGLLIRSWALHVVPSNMSRRPLLARIRILSSKRDQFETDRKKETVAFCDISVATCHFESMNASSVRAQQLAYVFKELDGKNQPIDPDCLKTGNGKVHSEGQQQSDMLFENRFLLGDFNFDADREEGSSEEQSIPKHYVDAWRELRSESSKKESVTVEDIKARLDQIRYHSTR